MTGTTMPKALQMLEHRRYPRSAKLCFLKALKMLEYLRYPRQSKIAGASFMPKALKMLEGKAPRFDLVC